jgi:hypothetical protein
MTHRSLCNRQCRCSSSRTRVAAAAAGTARGWQSLRGGRVAGGGQLLLGMVSAEGRVSCGEC